MLFRSWPVPTKGLKSFNNGKAGAFDPTGNGTILTGRGFSVNELAQVVEVAPVLGVGFSRKRPAVFLEVRQLKVIKVLVEREVGGVFGHVVMVGGSVGS